MKDSIKIKTMNFGGESGTRRVFGEVYRQHWFIHKDENKNYSLTHKNSGLRLNAFDSINTCKAFADVVIDDVGIDGSFMDVEDIPKYQRMVVKQLVKNLDFLKIQEFTIISSINHTH